MKLLRALIVVLAIVPFLAHSALLGPTYPAPGGNNWSGNGVNGPDGLAIWNYSNFDSNSFGVLYFGLNQTDYGALGAGLNGSVDPFFFHGVNSITTTMAEWRSDTTWVNQLGNVQNVQTRLLMNILGLGANPWITNLASIGLDTGYGDLGAVVNNSAGLDFSLQWTIEANTGSGWQAINTVQQLPQNDGKTRSSFATGFYYSEPVPAPAGLGLLAIGLLGFVAARRIRR